MTTYRCDNPDCDYTADNPTSVARHAIKHDERYCDHCWQPFAVNGWGTHEGECDATGTPGEHFPPHHVINNRLEVFAEHAEDIPDGLMVIIPRNGRPYLTRREQAAITLHRTADPFMAIPSELLPAADEAKRMRWVDRFAPKNDKPTRPARNVSLLDIDAA